MYLVYKLYEFILFLSNQNRRCKDKVNTGENMENFEILNEEDKYIAEIILDNSLNEAPTTSGGQPFADSLVGQLIFYIQEALNAKDMVDVQPINFKEGKVFGMDLLNSDGDVVQGVTKVDAFNAAFSEKGENTTIPDLQLKLRESSVVTKSRKARLNFSQELLQDLKVLKFDLAKERIKLIGTEIANGIDFDIVKAIKDHSSSYTPIVYSWANGGTLNIVSLLVELEMRIFDAAATIAAGTRKGLANFILVPASLAKLVMTMQSFEPSGESIIGAVNKVGKLSSMDVYVDTFDTTGFEMIVGKKPNGNISGGVVYSPYKIETGQVVTDPENFSLHQVVVNRYGITKIEGGDTMYCKVQVTTRTGFPFA
jgi:hypothetical protein